MKRTITLLLTLVLSTSICLAQKNKKLTSEDVQNMLKSTTHVVTTGDNMIYDALLKDAAKECWKVTPLVIGDYDYGSEKQSFLMVTNDVFEDDSEHGYESLALMQGRVGAKNVGNLPWIVSFPISSKSTPSEIDTELIVELMVMAVQNHVELIKWSPDMAKQSLNKLYNDNVGSLKGKTLYMMDEDVSVNIDREKLVNQFNGHMKLVGPAEIERLIKEKTPDAVISLTVVDKYCYKMLVGVADGKVYYYNRDKIATNKVMSNLYPAGFLQSDISKIASPFKK